MVSVVQRNFRIRNSYGEITKVIDIPNLIDIQKQSYATFLQMDVPAEERVEIGLQGVFKSVFPIKDFNETCSLEFVSYHLERPKYDVEECHQRGMTFAAPLKVVIRLVVWDKGEEDGVMPSIRDVKELEVYFGEIPLQTAEGTFIINGTERVVVSQLHRSPGAFFDHDRGKTHSSGKLLYSARVIPYRGSWLDFEFDAKDILYVRIDRRRKLPATIMLRALGYSTSDLLSEFYKLETIHLGSADSDVFYREPSDLQLLKTQKATLDVESESGDVLVRKNRKFTASAIRKMKSAGVTKIPALLEEIIGKVIADDVVDMTTGEVIAECNEEITEATIEKLLEHKIDAVETLFIDNLHVGPFLRKTAMVDKVETPDQAVLEIYKRLRPGDPPTLDTAYNLFNNLFFNPERYDLSKVGRLKLNHKFRIDESLENSVLTKKDIIEVVRYLIALRDGRHEITYAYQDGKSVDVLVKIDDIDHLGNRRVRAVGELMENQYRIGLVRMERAVKERMSMSQEIETLMPHDLINAKFVSAVVKEYFGSSQLS
jgi:DNA-directed RNA polymerase subunit beta